MKKIETNDPLSKSADIVADNLLQLQALFPEAFAEGKVDFRTLRQLLGETVDEGDEKYGLNWHGKRRARQIALTPSNGTLRPYPEESVDWADTQNLMIEGENLEVLKLLQKSYAGKVKMIYIDPPYNTGKDFIYPDDFHNSIKNYFEITGQAQDGMKLSTNVEGSGRFHTDWLSMIYPRLKLARDLLSQDGFIFVSIDDSEVHNLRQVLGEIFGEENFIANVVWQKKYTRANDAQFFSDNHDHILVFTRNKEYASMSLQPRNAEQISAYGNPDKHPKGLWKATPLHAKSGSNTSAYKFKNNLSWTPPIGTYRRFSDETMALMDAGDEIWFGTNGTSTPSRKSFLSDVKAGVTPVTIWPFEEVGHTHEANNELKILLGQGIFDNPKPTRLIRRMIELATEKDSAATILDFFAGSGSTGHAVMAQNAIDGGDRRFILVQLPEPLSRERKEQKAAAELCEKLHIPCNIAELTKERLRRAAKAISKDSQLLGGRYGFRSFKLDTSNIRAWDPDSADLKKTLLDHLEHLHHNRSEADIIYEILIKLGLDLCIPLESKLIDGKTVVAIGGGVLMMCLAERIDENEVEKLSTGMIAWHRDLAPSGDTTMVFRDSAFISDVSKVNLAAILSQHGIVNIRSL